MEMEGKEDKGSSLVIWGIFYREMGIRKTHARERVRRGAAVMETVWRIGVKRFKGDWGRRFYGCLTH